MTVLEASKERRLIRMGVIIIMRPGMVIYTYPQVTT